MYILQLNYWRGPIDAWPLWQNIAPRPPRIDGPALSFVQILHNIYWSRVASKLLDDGTKTISYSDNERKHNDLMLYSQT